MKKNKLSSKTKELKKIFNKISISIFVLFLILNTKTINLKNIEGFELANKDYSKLNDYSLIKNKSDENIFFEKGYFIKDKEIIELIISEETINFDNKNSLQKENFKIQTNTENENSELKLELGKELSSKNNNIIPYFYCKNQKSCKENIMQEPQNENTYAIYNDNNMLFNNKNNELFEINKTKNIISIEFILKQNKETISDFYNNNLIISLYKKI